MPKIGFTWATMVSLSLQLGCGQGHRDWLSWAVTPLGHPEVSGGSEGTAALVLSLSSEARSPGQEALGLAAKGVHFNLSLPSRGSLSALITADSVPRAGL